MSTSASSPFDHPKADIILRSSDGIDFRVFKLLLALASPFFETMFELPQPADGTSDDAKNGLPVIPVEEDGKTLDTFLRFCYPSTLAKEPSLESPTDILVVLGAARKYSLDLIESKVSQALVNPKLLEAEPLRCFAIARNARLKHETMTAARYTLREPLIPAWFAEIELITMSDLLALLTYHKKCSNAVESLLANLDWVQSHYGSSSSCTWLFCEKEKSERRYVSDSANGCKRSTEAAFELWGTSPVAWTLRDRPTGDNVRAEARKTILEVKTARKYSLDLIERKVCQALANPKVLETDPLRCFAIARNARLEHETITAAKHTLRQPLIPVWFAEIELITATDLLALLTYHKNCSVAVQTAVKDLKWIRYHYGSDNGCAWLFGFTGVAPYNIRSQCKCKKATDSAFSPWGSTVPVAWWETYMQETFKLLLERPSSDTVRTGVEKTIQKVRNSNCTTCSDKVKAGMMEFSELLASKVEQAVASQGNIRYYAKALLERHMTDTSILILSGD
ncbi:hypothetical protein M405DRAFT_880759 [Rhizopogon salebrosus TDB-379]|nr:hypothetical protein M405DRAFT_880759 [Rhizopogon salebrosus TDB-379]